jgi:hypothetical protein
MVLYTWKCVDGHLQGDVARFSPQNRSRSRSEAILGLTFPSPPIDSNAQTVHADDTTGILVNDWLMIG